MRALRKVETRVTVYPRIPFDYVRVRLLWTASDFDSTSFRTSVPIAITLNNLVIMIVLLSRWGIDGFLEYISFFVLIQSYLMSPFSKDETSRGR